MADPSQWQDPEAAPPEPTYEQDFYVSIHKGESLGFYEGPSSHSTAEPWPAPDPFPQPTPSAQYSAPGGSAPTAGGVPSFGPSMPSSTFPDLHAAGPVYSLGFWQSLFDVDALDVRSRICSAVLPFHPPDYLAGKGYGYKALGQTLGETTVPHPVNRNPDLYGPLWIGTTLCLVIVVMSHTLQTLRCLGDQTANQSKLCNQSWITPLALACTIVFSFEFLVPVGLWVVMKWKDVPLGLMELLCLYGYSFCAFIPGTLLWALPWAWLRWLAAAGALLASTASITCNLSGLWQQYLEPKWALGMVGVVVALQLLMTIILNVHFSA